MFKKDRRITDAHCHIQFLAYDNDRDEVIRRAREAGVHPHTKREAAPMAQNFNSSCSGVGVKMIVAGTQISTSRAAIGLAHEYPDDIWATVGFHPSHAVIRSEQDTGGTSDRVTRSEQDIGGAAIWHHDKNEQKEEIAEKFDIKQLKELAGDSKVVGIGECGLDYYRLGTSDPRTEAELGAGHGKGQATSIKNAQKEVFIEMAKLAAELKKPLVVHCRPSLNSNDAYLDLLDILNEIKFSQNVVMHCFTGSVEIAQKFLDVGFYPHTKREAAPMAQNFDSSRSGAGVYFTLGGIITFPDKKDKNKGACDEIVRYIPVDRIMAETDSPYIAPVPHRGKRNEPAFVVEVVKKISEIKGIPLDDLMEKLSGTVNKIFKI